MTQYNRTYADIVAEHEEEEALWMRASWEDRYEIDPKRAFTHLVEVVQELNEVLGEIIENQMRGSQ